MDTQPALGFRELFARVVGDIAKAVCEREGETEQQQYARSEAAAHMIMGFLPRDLIEAILAGRCVMFHELAVDSAHDALRGEPEATRRAARRGVIAMDKAFANNLRQLERYQLRPATDRRDGPEARPEERKAEEQTAEARGDPEAVGRVVEPAVRPSIGAAQPAARGNAAEVPPVAPMPNRAARRAAKLRTRAAQKTARTHSGEAGTNTTKAQGPMSEPARDLGQPRTGALDTGRGGHDHSAPETIADLGVSPSVPR